ncbi:unnamed protein product [Cuscuta campestris]|uniref:Uncharacterized protein n=1 Tax=Cuscuta campestris TaxID=132261 RepID=A0A484N148_9ASTE|nr:unnamed protein product [Cuscuta campestris]
MPRQYIVGFLPIYRLPSSSSDTVHGFQLLRLSISAVFPEIQGVMVSAQSDSLRKMEIDPDVKEECFDIHLHSSP